MLEGGTAVKCWGQDQEGELGDGAPAGTGSDVPVTVVGSPHISQLISGGSGYCAILTTGSVMCWGYKNQGGFGDDNPRTYNVVPVAVPGV